VIYVRITFALLLASFFSALHAQTWPAKPIRGIVPVGPGSPTDLVARSLAQFWAQNMGQPLVVENRAGASGIIGTEACAKAAADGYNVCFLANGQVVLNPLVFAKLPYDAAQDLAPVVHICDIPSAVTVHSSVPANSMRDLLELSAAKPGTLNWASWGTGSPSHLYLAWLENRVGGKFTHVPYKDPAQAWNALIAGEVQAMVNTTGLSAALVKAGKVKALAIVGAKRSTLLSEVPTLKEQGYDLQLSGWIGLFAPRAIPREVVQRLNTETNKFLGEREFVAKSLMPLGLEPGGGSPEDFVASIRADRLTSTELVKLANVKPQ
jgi:tripartite-type tricarboxylate transporter receptor subunit TctC